MEGTLIEPQTPPGTVADLGKKVKAKYPGEYDSLPDDEVGRRVKAKYPGSYDDFVEVEIAPQTPPTAPFPEAPQSQAPGPKLGLGAALKDSALGASLASSTPVAGAAEQPPALSPRLMQPPEALRLNAAAMAGDDPSLIEPQNQDEAVLLAFQERMSPYMRATKPLDTGHLFSQQYSPEYMQQKKDAGMWTSTDEFNYRDVQLRNEAHRIKEEVNRLRKQVQFSGADPGSSKIASDLEERARVLQKQYDDLYANPPQDVVDLLNKKTQEQADVNFAAAQEHVRKGEFYHPQVMEQYILRPVMNAATNFILNGAASIGRTLDAAYNAVTGEEEYTDLARAADNLTKMTEMVNASEGVKTKGSLFNNDWDLNTASALPQLMRTGANMALLMSAGAAGGAKGLVGGGYLSTENDYYNEAIKEGLTPDEAQGFSIMAAGGQALLELVNPQQYASGTAKGTLVRQALKALKGGMTKKDAILDGMKFVAKEIGGENLQEFSQQAHEIMSRYAMNEATGAKLDTDFTPQQAAELALMTTALSGLGAGIGRGLDKPINQQAMEWARNNPDLMREFIRKNVAQDEQEGLISRLDNLTKIYSGNRLSEMPPEKAAQVAQVIEKKQDIERDIKENPISPELESANGDPRKKEAIVHTVRAMEAMSIPKNKAAIALAGQGMITLPDGAKIVTAPDGSSDIEVKPKKEGEEGLTKQQAIEQLVGQMESVSGEQYSEARTTNSQPEAQVDEVIEAPAPPDPSAAIPANAGGPVEAEQVTPVGEQAQAVDAQPHVQAATSQAPAPSVPPAFKRTDQEPVSKNTKLEEVEVQDAAGNSYAGIEYVVPGFEEYRMVVVKDPANENGTPSRGYKVMEPTSKAWINVTSHPTASLALLDARERMVRAGKPRLDQVISETIRNFAPDGGQETAAPEAPAQAAGLPDAGGVRGGSGSVPVPDATPLEGAPTSANIPGRGSVQVGPNLVARQAAQDYMREAGIPYTPPKKYVKVDTERATRIASEFENMKHDPENPEVKKAYRALIDETLAQYQAIKKTGLKIELINIANGDPYAASPRLAEIDVRDNNHLWVFPTDDGFGVGEVMTDNPLLEYTNEEIDGQRLRANDLFRVVHDYFGHIKDGNGFRADGEENAWRSHSAMYSPLARRAMTTETRGQNSWVNYGPYGEHNRTASAADTHYADQKIGLLPEWVSEEGRTDEPPAPPQQIDQAQKDPDLVKKTVATKRAYEGDFRQEVKDEIEKGGLYRNVKNREETWKNVGEFVGKVGIGSALDAVRNGDIRGDNAAAVFAYAIKDVQDRRSKELDAEKWQQLVKDEAALVQESGDYALESGRYGSMMGFIYENTDLGFSAAKIADEWKRDFDQEPPPAVQDLMKQVEELRAKIDEANKKAAELEEKMAVEGIKESVKREGSKGQAAQRRALADRIRSLKIKPQGVASSFIVPPQLFNAAVEAVALAVQTGESVASAITKGIKLIQQSDWYKNLSKSDQLGSEKSFEDSINGVVDEPVTEGRISIPKSVIREEVKRGAEDIDALVERVKAKLGRKDVTDREVRDAITGYGRKVNMSKDEIDVEIRKQKRIGRLISALEDVKAQKRPAKNIVERDKIDAKEKALKAELKQAIKDLPPDLEADERKAKSSLEAAKTRALASIEELQRRLKEGDFAAKKGPGVTADAELRGLRTKMQQIREKYELEREKERRRRRNLRQKIYGALMDVLNVPKSLVSSLDFSAPLRQGVILSAGNPRAAMRAGKEMFAQAFSQEKADEWLANLKQTEDYKMMRDSGLYLAEPTMSMNAKEESFMSNLAEKIPIYGQLVKGSGRAYAGYLNKLRADVFMYGTERLRDQGITPENDPKSYTEWAHFINNATGRGRMHRNIESAAPLLNTLMFSPRYLASRVNLMNPVTYARMPKEARKMAMENMIAAIGFYAVVAIILMAAGADTDDDPESSDFGKFKFGNTRYDLMAGFQQLFVFFSRLLGHISRGEPVSDTVKRFARSKASPTVGTLINLDQGKDMVGDPVTLQSEAVKLALPLYVQDMKDVYDEGGATGVITSAVPAVFGVGVQTYKPRRRDSERSDPHETRPSR